MTSLEAALYDSENKKSYKVSFVLSFHPTSKIMIGDYKMNKTQATYVDDIHTIENLKKNAKEDQNTCSKIL